MLNKRGFYGEIWASNINVSAFELLVRTITKIFFWGGGVGGYISDDSKNHPHPRSHSFTVISFTQNRLKFTNITFTSYNILTSIFEMGSLLALFICIVEILGSSHHNS